MKTISKTLVGTVAAGAMAVASAAPAAAQTRWDGRDRDRGGISAGEVIAGAVILGGIAAAAGAFNGNNGRVYQGNGYYGNGYNGYDRAGDPRQAVEQCVNAATRGAGRYNAHVTDIRNIDRKRDGYTVKGRIAVNLRGNNWRGGNGYNGGYGRGWNNDFRGVGDQYRGYDAGNFTCRVQYGRIVNLDYSGIRGL